MKVLSLFDGISCARVALERAGIPVKEYYASEIDKYAIQVSNKNYPDIKQLGGVTDVSISEHNLNNKIVGSIDLLIGGSPCQDLSIAKKGRKGLDGERSGLFYEYVRILKEIKPKYFILENVASMSKEARDTITKEMGVEPIMINAALVSAQQRKRLFWTNIPNVTQPEDRGILLKDILEQDVDERYNINISEKYGLKGLKDVDSKSGALTASMHKGYGNDGVTTVRVGKIGSGGQGQRIYSQEGKSVALSALGGGQGAKTGLYEVPTAELKALTERRTEEAKKLRKEHRQRTGEDFSPRRAKELVERVDGKMNTITTSPTKENLVTNGYIYRKLTPIECERLQGLKDGYTEGISNTQRYKTLGNAFNVDVVAHILSFIPRCPPQLT